MKTLNQNLYVDASNQINNIHAQVDARIDEPKIHLKAWSDYLNKLNDRLGLNLSTSFRAVIPHLFYNTIRWPMYKSKPPKMSISSLSNHTAEARV